MIGLILYQLVSVQLQPELVHAISLILLLQLQPELVHAFISLHAIRGLLVLSRPSEYATLRIRNTQYCKNDYYGPAILSEHTWKIAESVIRLELYEVDEVIVCIRVWPAGS